MCANVAVIKMLNREIDKLEQRPHQCVRLRPEFRLPSCPEIRTMRRR